MIPPRIKSVEILENFNLLIIYVTGEKRKYDMNKQLNYDYYNKLKNEAYFKLVKSVGTTVEWPSGEDIDPNELYENGIVLN